MKVDCKNCKTELSEMKNDKGEVTCLRCLSCHPMTVYVAPKGKEPKYVDIKMTEKRVREIVLDVLENWHIQKPPVTVAEIKEKTEEVSWRDEAKALGIEIYDHTNKKLRLKVDVLKDIAEKTNVSEELQTQE